ncbi:MAG: protein kinase [Myxococcota bacterium]|nr:protein kinase [Myxococcota bacterium]
MHPTDFPDGYIPHHELGVGSMGQVWLARTRGAGSHCAVKVLNLRKDKRGSAERSFNREVPAMARLDHPGIIQVHDFGRTPKGSPFVAMEYVSGSPLNPYMRASWNWPRLWTLLDGLLNALGHAHARDLGHRDLKPGNIIVLPDRVGPGAIKLADFGIALAIADVDQSERRIEGTPAYIAPEAASGDVASVGPWTDLYSLGVMLFEVLTGDLPYHGRHLLAHHQRSPLPPIEVRPQVELPAGLVDVAKTLLQKKPMHRFRSIAELREALEALGLPDTPEPLGMPPKTVTLEDEYPEEAMTLQPLSGPSGSGLFHIRQPALVGRTDAQIKLETAAQAVIEGRGPRVVFVEGEAGVGKSYLASWLRERVEEHGQMRSLVIRSEPQSEYGGGLRQALLRFFGAPTASQDEAVAVFEEAFEDEETRQIAQEVLWSELPRLGGASDRHLKLAADLLMSVVGERPFLIWADDAQWSPEGNILRLLHRLARPDGPPNLLILATVRPSERSTVRAARRDLIKLPSAELIELNAVNPFELAPALEALAPLPPGLAEAACMMAAGNPLIALEAVRSFLETEGLGSAPTDPNAVLGQRIEQATRGELGGELRSTLARATLLGRSFKLRPLLHLCSVPGDPQAPALTGDLEMVEGLIETAVNSGLAVEQGPKRWRFSHDLIRTQLRKACRALPNWKALNEAAAHLRLERADSDPSGIELEVVARHFWEADESRRALALGLEGLNRLHGAGLMGHATSFARRLLRWNDDCALLAADDEGELRLLASIAAEHAGQPIEAENYARGAAHLAREKTLDALGARAAGRVGVLKLQQDDPESAEQWLWDALRFARASGDPRALADVNLSLGYFYQRRAKLDLARTAYQVSFEISLEHGLISAELTARAAIAGLDRVQGELRRAEGTFRTIADRALQKGLEVAALNAKLQLGLCAWNRHDPSAARLAFDEVRRGARGNLFTLEFYACLGAAWACAAENDWLEAEMCLMNAEDLRYDVRLRDPEAETLRLTLLELARDAHRPDMIDRIGKLDILRTSGATTQHSL